MSHSGIGHLRSVGSGNYTDADPNTRRPPTPQGGGGEKPPHRRVLTEDPPAGRAGGQGAQGGPTPDRRRGLHTGSPPTGPERRAPGDPTQKEKKDNKRETKVRMHIGRGAECSVWDMSTLRTPLSFRKVVSSK